MVRRHKDSSYITKSFPCDLGGYGHISSIIKQLVHQNELHPIIASKDNTGLVRKGIRRGNSVGDRSYLDAMVEILPNNSSINTLIRNIMYDLEKHPNIFSIAGGSFVNKFKKDLLTLTDEEIDELMNIIIRKHKDMLADRLEVFKKKKKIKRKQILELVTRSGLEQRSIVNQEIKRYTSLKQFERYLNDENEIIVDTYISPVLESIAKYPSKTFTEKYSSLGIITFEGNNEDVIISTPMNGFSNKYESMILLYKERGHLYEPILYRTTNSHVGILKEYTGITSSFNETFQTIIDCIQDKLVDFNNDNLVSDKLMDIHELKVVLDVIGLPIKKYIYDNYNKITYVVTNKKVMIPVRPSDMEDVSKTCKFISKVTRNECPNYSDVISILELVDENSSYMKYLSEPGISVIGKSSKSLKIKEIVMKTGHYISVKDEPYDKKKHTLPIVSIHSYRDIDNYLGMYNVPQDNRVIYSAQNDYRKQIMGLFFQTAYLLIKDNETLFSKIRKIKDSPIRLRIHKARDIKELLYNKLFALTDFIDDEYDINEPIFKKGKILIYELDEISCKDVFEKLLGLFVELLVVYDYSDYNRFLQIDVNKSTILRELQPSEILFTYTDIRNESYLEHFIRYSQYIRNIGLYGEELSRSKRIQLELLKKKYSPEIEFVNQYPTIIRTLFGRGLKLVKSKNTETDEIEFLVEILKELYSDREINREMINTIIPDDTEKLNKIVLDIISKQFNIGFCMVVKGTTRILQHDIITVIQRQTEDLPMILLYQSEERLIHIQKNDSLTTELGELKSSLFKKQLLC